MSTQPLITLLEIAERERDAAEGALAQAEDMARRLAQQLEQLQAYRADYESRSPAGAGRAAPIELLRCHQGFMLRLDQALVQQQGVLKQSQQRVEQQRSELMAHQMRVAGVRKLLERRVREQDAHGQRQEQRRSDELALQRHWRARTDSRLAAL
jgi:flagellar protein FliJ